MKLTSGRLKQNTLLMMTMFLLTSQPSFSATEVVFNPILNLASENLILTGEFSFPGLFRGMLGMFFLVLVAFLISKDKKYIKWRLVGSGLLLQLVLALLILKVPFISRIFDGLAKGFTTLIDFSHDGAVFLFGNPDGMPPMLMNFAFWILPTIIFFSAISALLYY